MKGLIEYHISLDIPSRQIHVQSCEKKTLPEWDEYFAKSTMKRPE